MSLHRSLFHGSVFESGAVLGFEIPLLADLLPSLGDVVPTFSRASAGTYIDADGVLQSALTDAPRIASDTGILLESPAENMLLYSGAVGDASNGWGNVGITATLNDAIAPNGETVASKIEGSGAAGYHRPASATIAFVSGTTYTCSIFAKAGTHNFIQLRGLSIIGGPYVNLDIANGLIGVVGNVASAADIQALENDWYLCTMTFTASTSASSPLYVYLVDSLTAVSAEQNSIADYAYLWGADVKVGEYLSSHIETEASTVSRVVDYLSYDVTEDVVQDKGSLGCYFTWNGSDGEATVFDLSDGTNDNCFRVYIDNSTLSLNYVVRFGGADVATATSTNTLIVGTEYGVAITYKDGAVKFYHNGVLVDEVSCALPVGMSTLTVGQNCALANQLNGTIRNIEYHGKALGVLKASRTTEPVYIGDDAGEPIMDENGEIIE